MIIRNIHLTKLQLERLKKLSKDEGLTIAELIRRAIDEYLALSDHLSKLNEKSKKK